MENDKMEDEEAEKDKEKTERNGMMNVKKTDTEKDT